MSPPTPTRSLSNLSEESPVCVTDWDDAASDPSSSCGGCGGSSSDDYTEDHDIEEHGPLSKSVAFAEYDEEIDITHVNDLSDEEIAAVWYNSSEYAAMIKNNNMTVFLMNVGADLNEEQGHTARGLEHHTEKGALARFINRRNAYDAVLYEQDLQFMDNVIDWETMADVYLEHSLPCREAAYRRGVNDAKYAKYVSKPSTTAKKLPAPQQSPKMTAHGTRPLQCPVKHTSSSCAAA